jgi:hypothetical protein
MSLNDQFDSTKPKSFLEAVGKDLLQKTQLGRLATSVGSLAEKLGIVRLGNLNKGGKQPLPNFDVLYEKEKDYRTRLVVPPEYLWTPSIPWSGGAGSAYPFKKGITFPFTPVITQEWSATYSTVNPTHSNYPLHFYKNSSISPISVSGKFAVQNKMDALTWLQTVHSLRALTKMHFGADKNKGAPPPVCRFFAYGEMQYNNVPVVVQSVRVDLPDSVDYYAAEINQDRLDKDNPSSGTMVPILSTITINLLPMYSRAELLTLPHVDDYLAGLNSTKAQSSKTKGFL